MLFFLPLQVLSPARYPNLNILNTNDRRRNNRKAQPYQTPRGWLLQRNITGRKVHYTRQWQCEKHRHGYLCSKSHAIRVPETASNHFMTTNPL